MSEDPRPREGEQLPEEQHPAVSGPGEPGPDERARESGLDPAPQDETPPRTPATGNPNDD